VAVKDKELSFGTIFHEDTAAIQETGNTIKININLLNSL
jgi:hypothetical protein